MTVIDYIKVLIFNENTCIVCKKTFNEHDESKIIDCFLKGSNQ